MSLASRGQEWAVLVRILDTKCEYSTFFPNVCSYITTATRRHNLQTWLFSKTFVRTWNIADKYTVYCGQVSIRNYDLRDTGEGVWRRWARNVAACVVGQWQVQLILLYVKAIVWLQPAAIVVTAYSEIFDTWTDYKTKTATVDWWQNCTLWEWNHK